MSEVTVNWIDENGVQREWTGNIMVAAALMDTELSESITIAQTDGNDQVFVDIYCDLHLAKYGEEFMVN